MVDRQSIEWINPGLISAVHKAGGVWLREQPVDGHLPVHYSGIMPLPHSDRAGRKLFNGAGGCGHEQVSSCEPYGLEAVTSCHSRNKSAKLFVLK